MWFMTSLCSWNWLPGAETRDDVHIGNVASRKRETARVGTSDLT
jgi:hypothetical protein